MIFLFDTTFVIDARKTSILFNEASVGDALKTPTFFNNNANVGTAA